MRYLLYQLVVWDFLTINSTGFCEHFDSMHLRFSINWIVFLVKSKKRLTHLEWVGTRITKSQGGFSVPKSDQKKRSNLTTAVFLNPPDLSKRPTLQVKQSPIVPSRELTYQIMEKGKPSSKVTSKWGYVCSQAGIVIRFTTCKNCPWRRGYCFSFYGREPYTGDRGTFAVRLYTAQPAQPSTLIPHETFNCLCKNYEVWHLNFQWIDNICCTVLCFTTFFYELPASRISLISFDRKFWKTLCVRWKDVVVMHVPCHKGSKAKGIVSCRPLDREHSTNYSNLAKQNHENVWFCQRNMLLPFLEGQTYDWIL